MICTLGDLLLDVVVRLDGPLVRGHRTTGGRRVSAPAARRRTWPPGRPSSAARRGSSASARRTRPGGCWPRSSAGAASRWPAPRWSPAPERSSRWRAQTGHGRCERPGRLARLRPGGAGARMAPRAASGSISRLHAGPLADRRTAMLAAEAARDPGGARVSLDLASVSAIRALGAEAFRERVAALAPDVIFGNADEVDLVRRPEARFLIVKRGADGCLVNGEAYPAVPTEVVDTTGAGDALAAGFLVGRHPTSGCRRPHAASPAWERCRDRGSRPRSPRRSTATARSSRSRRRSSRTAFRAGEGLEVGLACEAAVRAAGAIPATIGVLDGEIRVGLDDEELQRFADAPDARKAGPRDLAACAAQGAIGATTVGGTLTVCRTAGIWSWATGGIGGVHRGWAQSFDISADIGALANTPALVVAVRREVDPRRSRDRGAPRDLRRPGARLPHGRAAALLRGAAAVRRSRRASSPPPRRRRSRRAHWKLGGCGAAARPPARREPDDVEPLIEDGTRGGGAAGRARPGGDAVRPRVPAREKRRRDGRARTSASSSRTRDWPGKSRLR